MCIVYTAEKACNFLVAEYREYIASSDESPCITHSEYKSDIHKNTYTDSSWDDLVILTNFVLYTRLEIKTIRANHNFVSIITMRKLIWSDFGLVESQKGENTVYAIIYGQKKTARSFIFILATIYSFLSIFDYSHSYMSKTTYLIFYT